MNIVQGAAIAAVSLIAGVGLTVGVLSGQRSPQVQVSGSQPITSTSPTAATPIVVTSRLNMENFNRLTIGATLPQVEEILGNGVLSSQSNIGTSQSETWQWLEAGQGITLGFQNGKLSSKHQFGLKSNPAATGITPATPVAMTTTPAAVATTVPAPSPIVSFDQMGPCDQLDAVARSGKSVSQFLVESHRVGDLGKYKAAIGSTCPWNAEQLQVADRVINPPVVVVKPRVVRAAAETVRTESSQPDQVVRFDRPTRHRREPATEGSCYAADPSQCPRDWNGNPYDNQPAGNERRESGERRGQFKSLEW